MEEMTMYRMELLPDSWHPQDPRAPKPAFGWVIEDLVTSLDHDNWIADEPSGLAQEIEECELEKPRSALNLRLGLPPLKLANFLREAAFKIESQTIRPESELRN